MAFSFNGTSSYIETTSTPVTGTPFTMACWFQCNTTNLTKTIMYMGNSNSSHKFELGIDNNLLRLAVRSVGGGSVFAYHNTAVSTSAWMHATAVCVSPSSRFVILNGTNKIENTAIRTPIGLNSINLGAENPLNTRGGFLNGYIAEAGIWNAALTDDEVLSLSKGFAPSLIRPSNLKFYNRCIQKSQDLYEGRALTEVNITKTHHPRIYG
jgi:hypothetical protein